MFVFVNPIQAGGSIRPCLMFVFFQNWPRIVLRMSLWRMGPQLQCSGVVAAVTWPSGWGGVGSLWPGEGLLVLLRVAGLQHLLRYLSWPGPRAPILPRHWSPPPLSSPIGRAPQPNWHGAPYPLILPHIFRGPGFSPKLLTFPLWDGSWWSLEWGDQQYSSSIVAKMFNGFS